MSLNLLKLNNNQGFSELLSKQFYFMTAQSIPFQTKFEQWSFEGPSGWPAREFVNSYLSCGGGGGGESVGGFPNADRRALSVIPECWYNIYATRGRPRYVADYFT